jgi:hypothetical protein
VGLRRRKTVLIGLWSFAGERGADVASWQFSRNTWRRRRCLWLIKILEIPISGVRSFIEITGWLFDSNPDCLRFLVFLPLQQSQRHMQRGGPYLLLLVFVFL